MSDESNSDGLLVIRASRRENGTLQARITHGTAGQNPDLEISSAADEAEVVTIVKNWLTRIRT
ncbi:MAG: hypothetical protein HKN91_07075 [Acidimicrobiia bacterium]|nr:hypothetical protein [Acidimicrobiia bacterium]